MIDRATCGMVLSASLISQSSRRSVCTRQESMCMTLASQCVCVFFACQWECKCAWDLSLRLSPSLSLSVSLSFCLRLSTTYRNPKTKPSCVVLYASLGGFWCYRERWVTWPCIAKQQKKKVDVSVRGAWLRRNLRKYPLKVTERANVRMCRILLPFPSFACVHDCVGQQTKWRKNR